MNLYKQFKTDTNVERTGILLEYGQNSADQPIRIRIARAGGANDQYTKRLEARVKPLRRQIANETADPAELSKIVREVFAETVVLGWEGVEDADGQPLPFSRDNCIKLFADLPDLFADVQEQATRVALFRAGVREVDAKN